MSIASSMIFLGFLLGGISVGPFADKLGRRLTIYVYGAIIGVFGLLTAFPQVYWLFVVFRFLVGFGVGKFLNRAKLISDHPDLIISCGPEGKKHKMVFLLNALCLTSLYLVFVLPTTNDENITIPLSFRHVCRRL